VQDEILEKWGSPDLRVYAIWLPFRSGTRDAIVGSVMDDPRVRHYWDGKALSSDFFSRHLPDAFPGIWDIWVAYGPDARWDAEPAPLARWGGTVIGEGSSLMATIQSFLGPPE
jgi:hypothetical protein